MTDKLQSLVLDTDKYLYIGCIPVCVHPEHPNDQSPCTIISCPNCDREIWFSEKKEKIRDANPDKVRVYCLECLAIAAMYMGYEPELLDIGKMQ